MSTLQETKFNAHDFIAVGNWLIRGRNSLSTTAIEGILESMRLRLEQATRNELSEFVMLKIAHGEVHGLTIEGLFARIDELQNNKIGEPLKRIVKSIIDGLDHGGDEMRTTQFDKAL